ncbi:MAG: aminotransferase class I/II-fold pyridoxal phosphate-dependent enzyme [Spirochaetaceae bacterium]|jgi:histidinol-phosphate/aromatic aminotransferase/cobyric acid decarboxylase-like protein/choline kinase|nr:aminotransferase class I/II-fold pyridoxal phosphate-dependent enzyme [Spirochaetaceae bacterium]
MQAVILAAGMGSRLGKYTQNNTKCMLSINGRTLIERALDALDKAEITKCIIVVGYQKNNLMDFVGNQYKNIKITYIVNDIYHKTNNIYSLFLAKEYLLQDDTLLLESDLIFEERIIEDLLANPEPTLAVVARYESWMDGTVVQISGDTIITNFIPRKFFNYDEKENYYKTVNIYKFSRDFLRRSYVPFLEAYSQAMGSNEYYEQVLRVITTLDKNELRALVLDDHQWYEIDDIQDKDIAELIFCDAPAEKLRLMQRRYGGYWRFPKLKDFCYLVNPYFPTEQMLNELKASFDDLIAEYPSGLNVLNLLTGKLFNIDEANILTGNGAAELIRAIALETTSTGIPGGAGLRVGIIYPTFNEYPESFGENVATVPFFTENMRYDVSQVIDYSGQCDALVLINPDNPTGNYIPAAGVRRLLDAMKAQNKRLILDESFIDFCDEEDNPSLLRQDILQEYPNLIIIKSISKSYGVPGLRLGVLASGDKALIGKIRKNLSIWNINSFGEYFLQIIGKYLKDYRRACRLVCEERRRFKEELEKTGLFEVYPSQANYFLCRYKGDKSAKELTQDLLKAHNIFIKDLTGKKGIPGGSWIRLAVRNREDNDFLITALSRLMF